MNALRRLKLLIALAGLCACCAHPTNPPAPTTPVGTFEHCTSAALTATAQHILGDVTTALVTGGYVLALADLATRFGTAEVGCAVDLVIAEFNVKASRSDDAQVAAVLSHARVWRANNP